MVSRAKSFRPTTVLDDMELELMGLRYRAPGADSPASRPPVKLSFAGLSNSRLQLLHGREPISGGRRRKASVLLGQRGITLAHAIRLPGELLKLISAGVANRVSGIGT